MVRGLGDECPGEKTCAREKGRPIFQAIFTSTTAAHNAEVTANPPRELVENCCANCPLNPTKPGEEKASPAVLAAVESGCKLQRWVDSGMDRYIFRTTTPSARRIAALTGITNAINRSKLKANREIESNLHNHPAKKPAMGDMD